MTFDQVCEVCRGLPSVTEDVKWGDNLVFSVGEKMFVALGMSGDGVGFKCTPERFEALIERPGITPAKYLARAQWVNVAEENDLSDDEYRDLLQEAYETVFAKLPKRVQRELSEPT